MPRLIILIAAAALVGGAGVRTYEVPNNPQWDGATQPYRGPTTIEQLFPNDNNSWVSHSNDGTYGCSYIAATRTVQCR